MIKKAHLSQFHSSGRTLAHRVGRHSAQILKVQPYSAPWSWMAICGLTTFVPLLVGQCRGDVAHSIYGALTGYFLGLGDHKGTLKNRIAVATLGLFANLLFFVTGVLLQHHFGGFVGFTVLAVYAVGLLGGRGAEFERLLLFSIVQLLVARYAGSLTPALLPSLGVYFAVAYGTILVGMLLTRLTVQKVPETFATIRQSSRHFVTRNLARHLYALSYAVAVLLALLCVQCFSIPRGYWTAITIVLITKADRKESIYRVFQRIFGTVLGVCTGGLILLLHLAPGWMIVGAGLCAALVPFVWQRNYWLVTFLATNLVLALLSTALFPHADTTALEALTGIRLRATLYGCLISLVTVAAFHRLETMLVPRSRLH